MRDEAIFCSNISEQNAFIPWPWGEKICRPGKRPDSVRVSGVIAYHLAFHDIPDLAETVVRSNSNAGTSLRPLYWSNTIVGSKICKFSNSRSGSRPEINVACKTDCQNIARWPVQEVEIVVIFKGRRIKDFKRCFRNLSLILHWNHYIVKFRERSFKNWFLFLSLLFIRTHDV